MRVVRILAPDAVIECVAHLRDGLEDAAPSSHAALGLAVSSDQLVGEALLRGP
jgi:hypothetical protein